MNLTSNLQSVGPCYFLRFEIELEWNHSRRWWGPGPAFALHSVESLREEWGVELSRMQPPKSKIKYSKATMATRKCNCAHSVTRPFFSSIFILVHRPCASNFYVNRHEAGNCVCAPVVPIGSLFFYYHYISKSHLATWRRWASSWPYYYHF